MRYNTYYYYVNIYVSSNKTLSYKYNFNYLSRKYNIISKDILCLFIFNLIFAT